MKPRHPRSKPPVLRVEHVPQQHADFVHSRCAELVDHWGRNIRHLSLDHLVLSLYTQGMSDGYQAGERSYEHHYLGKPALPQPDPKVGDKLYHKILGHVRTIKEVEAAGSPGQWCVRCDDGRWLCIGGRNERWQLVPGK